MPQPFSPVPEMERDLQLQASFHFGNSAVRTQAKRYLPSAPITTQLPAKMGIKASKELSVTILQACTAAEQAGEQQLDKTLSDVVSRSPHASVRVSLDDSTLRLSVSFGLQSQQNLGSKSTNTHIMPSKQSPNQNHRLFQPLCRTSSRTGVPTSKHSLRKTISSNREMESI
jgi:hypothetical protein